MKEGGSKREEKDGRHEQRASERVAAPRIRRPRINPPLVVHPLVRALSLSSPSLLSSPIPRPWSTAATPKSGPAGLSTPRRVAGYIPTRTFPVELRISIRPFLPSPLLPPFPPPLPLPFASLTRSRCLARVSEIFTSVLFLKCLRFARIVNDTK